MSEETFKGLVSGAVCLFGSSWVALACAGGFSWFQAQFARDKQLALRALKQAHDELVEKKNQKDRPSGSTPPSTTVPPITAPPTDADVDAALKRFMNGDIDKDQYNEIRRRRDCAQGWADACAAPGQ